MKIESYDINRNSLRGMGNNFTVAIMIYKIITQQTYSVSTLLTANRTRSSLHNMLIFPYFPTTSILAAFDKILIKFVNSLILLL